MAALAAVTVLFFLAAASSSSVLAAAAAAGGGANKDGRTSGTFWHITDFHLDLNYSTSGNAWDMCWNNGTVPTERSFLPDGKFGDYRCDSPYRLVQAAMDGMVEIDPKPDFILWTGDDKAHVPDVHFSEEKVYDLVANLTATIEGRFADTPLVPVLGNHDWYPTHQLPGHNATLYQRIGELWSKWMEPGGMDTFTKGGYYTAQPKAGVRFVVLNTALYYNKNKLNASNAADPGDQFRWLEAQLTKAAKQNYKVYITSHVPPGVFERHFKEGGFSWLKPEYNERYVKIVVEHSSVIAGQFFAHHHTDSFRLFLNDAGEAVSWLLVAPAVTPWNTTLSQVGPNNPGLRRFRYSATSDNQQIQTYEQYFLNLSRANANADKDGVVKWELEYDASRAYGLNNSITPESLGTLARSFLGGGADDFTLFDRYYLYNSVSYQSASECDDRCRLYHHCAITRVDYAKFETCRREAWNKGKDDYKDSSATHPSSFLSLVSVSLFFSFVVPFVVGGGGGGGGGVF